MEEILASIRRIIADDEAKPSDAKSSDAKPSDAKPSDAKLSDTKPSGAKPVAAEKASPPPAVKAEAAKPASQPAAAVNNQDDIDAMLASLDAATPEADIRPAQPEPEADVFELTDEMAVAEPAPAPVFNRVEMPDDIEFSEAGVSHQPAYEPPPTFEAPPAQQMLSRSTVSAVESAFNSLANTVLSNNARTLEDLVKEMLRPMLKSWLDDNLPGLVERIVKAEIERVSRGR
jgi:cell pole-organizing protein PopZ